MEGMEPTQIPRYASDQDEVCHCQSTCISALTHEGIKLALKQGVPSATHTVLHTLGREQNQLSSVATSYPQTISNCSTYARVKGKPPKKCSLRPSGPTQDPSQVRDCSHGQKPNSLRAADSATSGPAPVPHRALIAIGHRRHPDCIWLWL